MEPTDRVTPTHERAPSAPGASDALTRGFLFADLRGYTSYVETRGAVAAADLLYRYRAFVRDAVAQRRGAEIKTEGDSFYVVFTSVSRAVECGLAIVAAAARATTEFPDQPIAVGVGVHAGETVETPEGYVGSAVNMAARLCAAAAAGEVLVSDTVRALTANTSDIRFVSAGRRRLKGIAEPVAVHRALPAGVEMPRQRSLMLPSRMIWVAATAAAILLVVAGIALAGGFGSGVPGASLVARQSASPPAVASDPPASFVSPSPSEAAVGAIPVGPLNPGTYVSRVLYPGVTFTVGTGWSLVNELPQGIYLTRSEGQGQDMHIVPLRGAIDPEDPDGRQRVAGVDDALSFVEWAGEHPNISAESSLLVALPDSRGSSIDFVATVEDDRPGPCGVPCVMLFWVTEDTDAFDRFAIADAFAYRLVAVDRLTWSEAPPTMIVLLEVQRQEDFDAFASEAQTVINTISFTDE